VGTWQPFFVESGTLADLATIAACVVALVALAVTARQARSAALHTRGTMWLELRRMFDEHTDVHQKLRPGGEWSRPGTGPDSIDDWVSVESYMGLLEHCEIMIEQGVIDWPTFKRLYAYRVLNLVGNRQIYVAKLDQQSDGWRDFSALLERIQASP
jgi:hypothetical protein